jgi:hypothetical protein
VLGGDGSVGGGGLLGGGRSAGATSTSQKTLTVIIKFDDDKGCASSGAWTPARLHTSEAPEAEPAIRTNA